MSFTQPLVLEGLDLSAAIDYILRRQDGLTTLAVCCSRASFLRSLESASVSDGNQEDKDERGITPPKWRIPTLRLLASSRTVKLAFCPSLPHLRAFLASYAFQSAESVDLALTAPSSTYSAVRTLAVLNLVQLHRPTSAFSAQGLNRTMALAVEAAAHSKRNLLFFECPMSEMDSTDPDLLTSEEAQNEPAPEVTNPWNEEVSILNVTTKSFGVGDRGWVGRTVTVRQIAARWCDFKQL